MFSFRFAPFPLGCTLHLVPFSSYHQAIHNNNTADAEQIPHLSPHSPLPCLPGASILSAGSGRLTHRLQTCPCQLHALHGISQEAALHGPTAISQMLSLDFLLQGNKCVSPDLVKCAVTLQVPYPSPVGAQKIRWMAKASEVRLFILP